MTKRFPSKPKCSSFTSQMCMGSKKEFKDPRSSRISLAISTLTIQSDKSSVNISSSEIGLAYSTAKKVPQVPRTLGNSFKCSCTISNTYSLSWVKFHKLIIWCSLRFEEFWTKGNSNGKILSTSCWIPKLIERDWDNISWNSSTVGKILLPLLIQWRSK